MMCSNTVFFTKQEVYSIRILICTLCTRTYTIIGIQQDTVHFPRPKPTRLVSNRESLRVLFYCRLLLLFLGPLTKAQSTAIVCPSISVPSRSSLAAKASLYVSNSTRA